VTDQEERYESREEIAEILREAGRAHSVKAKDGEKLQK